MIVIQNIHPIDKIYQHNRGSKEFGLFKIKTFDNSMFWLIAFSPLLFYGRNTIPNIILILVFILIFLIKVC